MTARNFREVQVSILISAYDESPKGSGCSLLLREDVSLEEFVYVLALEIEDGTCGGTMVHTRHARKPKVSV